MKTLVSLSKWSGVVAILLMVTSVLWTGCSPANERYYCDDNGCYSCDGYGCSTVTPPASQPCTGNSSCASGSMCTAAGCEKACQSTTDCERGTVCKEGLCSAPGGTSNGDAGTKECTTKTDCTGGAACVANKCQACGGTNGPCPCAVSADCSNGDTCAGGVCTAPKNTCKFSSECADGKTCANGQCVTTCTASGQCGAGLICTQGVCEPDPSQATCKGDANCSGSTPKCVSGSCVPACTGDASCAAGQYCNEGACVSDTRPKPICSASDSSACHSNSSDAGPSEMCVDGYCKYSCNVDHDCQIIDSRIGFCGTDKVCRNQTEAHPQCTVQADCPAGKACVGNLCK